MILQVKNIKKYFPVKKGFLGKTEDVVKAVDNVSLDFEAGESLGIVGESGSGKTTLARVMMQLYLQNEGQIIFDGKEINRKNLALYRRHVQMVFQDPFSSLDPRFSVRSIINEGMGLSPKYQSTQDREIRAQELMEDVQLQNDMLNRYPHEFSGGERQRIAIARALAIHPEILILDEAVSSLDVIIQQQVLELLLDLQKKFSLTYVFISHNLKVIRKVCQRIAVMYQGKIVELAPAHRIFENPQHPYTQQLLTAAVDYQASKEELPELDPHGFLIDQGEGHFVYEQ